MTSCLSLCIISHSPHQPITAIQNQEEHTVCLLAFLQKKNLSSYCMIDSKIVAFVYLNGKNCFSSGTGYKHSFTWYSPQVFSPCFCFSPTVLIWMQHTTALGTLVTGPRSDVKWIQRICKDKWKTYKWMLSDRKGTKQPQEGYKKA